MSSKFGVAAPLAVLLLCYFSSCECFTSKFQTPSSFVRQRLQSRGSVPFARCDAKTKSSEFSVVDEEEDDGDGTEVDFRQRKHGGGDLLVINEDAKSRRRSEVDDGSDESSSGSSRNNSLEYAALRPGTVVQVQVGDLSLARKAWKKRRRTGSPLLVPCSILNVDRRSAVRWNLIFLLEKFGQPGKGKRGGIVMSIKDLARSYRSFLKSSLGRQAEALGFDSSQAMVEELFNKKNQESYGVFFETKEEEKECLDEDGNLVTSTVPMLYLTAPINRRKAQQRASNPAMIQFRPPRDGDYDDIGAADTSIGTSLDQGEERGERKLHREYSNFPLSACLRVSQKDDLDTGRVQEGKILPAVVFDFDKIGDGGSPLLTLSLNAASGGKQRLKIKPDRRYKILKKSAKYQFSDLKVGDGPYRAKVIKLIGGKQKALVDLGVGRELSSAGGNTVQVLGTLRYKDSVELVDSERLQVGEYIEVYISNVSKQSNKFQVTTNPLVKGQKAKDIKKEAGTKKKLDRLKKSFGGDLNRIYALEGRECEGIVKATSKTGDWVYVQPSIEDLPVGVAALGSDDISGLSAGDNVRVRLSGIDEERGQLSMDVIGKV
eukprot:jgi/Psemu1/200773/e_gw1.264.46.1